MSTRGPRWQRPGVVFQPVVYEGMQRGINQMVDLVSPTLGPSPRVVMLEPEVSRNKLPEMLDDGATIVRRILQLPQREQDVGAMYLRHVLWTMHEDVGDGTATAAVMFREVYNEGIRCITAGNNAMRLRYHLDRLDRRQAKAGWTSYHVSHNRAYRSLDLNRALIEQFDPAERWLSYDEYR